MEFIDYLKQRYKKEFVDAYLEQSNKDRTYSFILNTNKYSLNEIKDIKITANHPFIDNSYYYDHEKLGNDYRFKNGVFYIQDAAAMMNVHLLDIEENDIVLDMCAAPGGKSIDAAIKLNNSGQLISNEINYERAKILSSNIEKMGFCNVFVTNNDFSLIYNKYKNTFDKIILDAPCSGSFMFRKNELMKEDWNENKVLNCSKTQAELLYFASIMVKPGGKIAYSTCSLSKEENEDIIGNFLKENENFELVEIKDNHLFYKGDLKNTIYLMPHIFDGEGQFICILKRKKEENFVAPTFKKHCKTSIFSNLINDFNLNDFNYFINKGDLLYCYNTFIDLSYFNILRYGLNFAERKKNVDTPTFQLAHYMSVESSIKLNEKSFNDYIKGYELHLDIEDGFHVVSYNNINLGFVKSKNRIQKNYYPKGLRIK